MDRLTRSFPLALAILMFVVAPVARAASDRTVTFSTPVSLLRTGDLVSVDVLLTNLQPAVNAIDLTVHYPADTLAIVHVSRAQSALSLWPEVPTWNATAGTIHIVGGVPHGLYAKDARVVTLTMAALKVGSAKLTLDTQTSAVFLNDGQGSRAALPSAETTIEVASDFTPGIHVTSTSHPNQNEWSTNGTVVVDWDRTPDTQYSFAFSPDGQTVPDEAADQAPGALTYPDLADGRYAFTIKSRAKDGTWSAVTQRWFLIDRTAPEPFSIQQLPPSSVGGQAVIAWSATDAMSGATSSLRVGSRLVGTVTSPLKLDPTWAGKTLVMTLTDLAGNTRTASWVYPNGSLIPLTWRIVGGVMAALLIVAATILVMRRRR